MKKIYKWIAKKITNKYVKLYADIVILLASSYLMIKKLLDFSISDWLLKNALQQPMVDIYVVVSVALLGLAILAKILIILVEQFPPSNHNFVEPDELSTCLFRMNSEISAHLSKAISQGPINVRLLCDQHSFAINLALIVDAMAEHIKKSVPDIKVKNRDIFISLYSHESEKNELAYILHYDPKKDLVESTIIKLDDDKYTSYESVKCMNSNNKTAYVIDKTDYAKGASKRFKTVQHYMGCKLSSESDVFGFLNIEFHNHAIFTSEDEMKEFMEEHIFPFKFLLEYQFLKRKFFTCFQDFEKHWRLQ